MKVAAGAEPNQPLNVLETARSKILRTLLLPLFILSASLPDVKLNSDQR